MSLNRLIGISGLKRSGKDTLAGVLAARLLKTQRNSFAEPLRAFGKMTFDITEHNREEMIYGLGGLKGRDILQLVGTEVGRNVHPEFWIHSLIHRAGPLYGTDTTLVITDVRFDNEAEFIKQNGGVLVHVFRPGFRLSDAHKSEAGISTRYIDYGITNGGTLEEYRLNCQVFASWYQDNWIARDTLEALYLGPKPPLSFSGIKIVSADRPD